MAKLERRRWSIHPLARYGIAVVSVIVALISARWLDIYLVSAPVSLFLCAAMFSAWFGGLKPGLVVSCPRNTSYFGDRTLATALSVLAFKFYFAAPVYSLAVDINEIPRVLLFALSALFVGLMTAAQRSATESLRRARQTGRNS
jgi:K+-sensing histidine kinase KdpD